MKTHESITQEWVVRNFLHNHNDRWIEFNNNDDEHAIKHYGNPRSLRREEAFVKIHFEEAIINLLRLQREDCAEVFAENNAMGVGNSVIYDLIFNAPIPDSINND